MGLRQVLNLHPYIAASVAVLILMFAAFSVFRSSGSPPPDDFAFYTTDDGVTLFTDDLRKVPPFDHDGKPAVRALVFTCDNGQHRFVQYLFKYSDAVKQRLEASNVRVSMEPGLIKKPGADDKWIDQTDPRASNIMTPKCPDGSGPGPMRQVWP